MLEISPAKVAHIIIKAREYDAKVGAWDDNIATGDSEEEPQSILEDFSTDAARAELAEFIAGLNEDEQANLVALTWVGRGTYSAEQFDEAVGECPSRDFADDARIAHDDPIDRLAQSILHEYAFEAFYIGQFWHLSFPLVVIQKRSASFLARTVGSPIVVLGGSAP